MVKIRKIPLFVGFGVVICFGLFALHFFREIQTFKEGLSYFAPLTVQEIALANIALALQDFLILFCLWALFNLSLKLVEIEKVKSNEERT